LILTCQLSQRIGIGKISRRSCLALLRNTACTAVLSFFIPRRPLVLSLKLIATHPSRRKSSRVLIERLGRAGSDLTAGIVDGYYFCCVNHRHSHIASVSTIETTMQ
jgi:hypothetical protein